MNTNSFYQEDELKSIGFKKIGKNVLISRKMSFYSPSTISIGDNVRIDDFCILSGNILLGSNIHIGAYCVLYGGKGIEMMDYSGLSARCTIYSITDDFSGDYLVGVTVNNSLRNVIGGKVTIHKYVQIGAATVILPNLEIGEGVAVGSMSLVLKSLEAWTIYAGIPVKRIKHRSKKMLTLL